jgi:dihydroorotase
VLEAMQDIGMPLLVHGEVTDAHDVDIFDREAVFIERTWRRWCATAGAEGGFRTYHHARGG